MHPLTNFCYKSIYLSGQCVFCITKSFYVLHGLTVFCIMNIFTSLFEAFGICKSV